MTTVGDVVMFAGTAADDDQLVLRLQANTGNLEWSTDGVNFTDDLDSSNGLANGTDTRTVASLANVAVQLGDGNDLLTVDFANGNLVPAGGLTYDGGGQTDMPGDRLRVVGDGATTNAVYTPDAAVTGSGTVTVDGVAHIAFSGLEPIDLIGMATATLATPAGAANDDLTLSNGTDSSGDPAIVASGTTGVGMTGIETVAFRNNLNVVIDTTASDGTDTIAVASADNAHGNVNVRFITGMGGDAITYLGRLQVTGEHRIDSDDATIADNGDADVDIAANSLVVSGAAFGAAADPIETEVASLSVNTAAANGNQFISEANGLTTLNLNAGAGNITLTAGGAITDGDADVDIAANAATVTATAFGAMANPIGTNVASLSVNTSAANGNQFISEANGLTALNLNAGAGNITLTAGGAITDGDADVDITATAATVTATAVGAAGNYLGTSVENLTVNTSGANGSQFIRETNGLAAIDLFAGTGDVNLTAGGSITDTDGSVDIRASAATVIATAFGTAANSIRTTVASLTVNTSSANGDQFIRETDGLTALNLLAGGGNITLVAGGAVADADSAADIRAASATVVAPAFGTAANPLGTTVASLTVNTSAANGDQFIRETDGLTALNLLAGTGNITLTAGGAIVDTDAATDVTATDFLLSARGGIGTAASSLLIRVVRLDVTNLIGGGIFIRDVDNGLTLADLGGPNARSVNGVGGGGAIQTTGPLLIAAEALTSGGMAYVARDDNNDVPGQEDNLTVAGGVTVRDTSADLTLAAGDDLLLNVAATVRAAGTLRLQADSFSPDPDAAGATVNLFGTMMAGAGGIQVLTGNGDDQVTIDSNGGGPADGGTVDNVKSPLTVDARGGADSLTLDDTGDATADNVNINDAAADTITGLVSNGSTIAYTAGLETLTIGAGSGADVFRVAPDANTAMTLDANAPAGDQMTFVLTGLTNPALTMTGPGAGRLEAANRRQVTFADFERLTTEGTPHQGLDFLLNMATLGFQNGVADAISLRRGTLAGDFSVEVRINNNLLFVFQETTIDSLTVQGSSDSEALAIVETVNGLPAFRAPTGGALDGVESGADNPNLAGRPDVQFNGNAGNDTLTYAFFGGNPFVYDQFYAVGNGQNGADEGEILTRQAGMVGGNGFSLYFTGLEPVANAGPITSGGPAGGALTVRGNAANNALIVDRANRIGPAGGASSRTRVLVGGFEPFDFSSNTFTGLTVEGLGGADTIEARGYSSGEATLANLTMDAHTAAADLAPDDNAADILRLATNRRPGDNGGIAALVLGRGGNDTIEIGSPGNTLANIVGPVTVEGGAHAAQPTAAASVTAKAQTVTVTVPQGDFLAFHDQADSGAHAYNLSATTFQRIAPAPAGGTVTFNGVETIQLNAGIGASTVTVAGTPASSRTVVNTQNGNDTIAVQSTGASSILEVNANGGADTIQIQTTGNGSIVIANAGAGNDTLTLAGSGQGSGVQLNGQSGNDTFNINGTGASSLLNARGDAGTDAFLVRATAQGSFSDLHGGADTDTFNISSDGSPAGGDLDGIDGEICVFGEDHNPGQTSLTILAQTNTLPSGDILNLGDGGDADGNTYQLTATTFRRTAPAAEVTGTITYATVETVNFTAGMGGDTINVLATAASVNTVINANAGADTVNITATGASSNLVVNGQTGNDSITLQATGTGAFALLNGDGGEDTIAVETTAAGSRTAASGGADNDRLDFGDPGAGGATLDRIFGAVVADGGGNGGATRTVRSNVTLSDGPLNCDTQLLFAAAPFDVGDTLRVLDDGETQGNRYDITVGAVIRQGGPTIVRQNVETVDLRSGSGNDVFFIPLPDTLGPHPAYLPLGSVIAINANGGDDFVEIRGTANADTILVGAPNGIVDPFEIANVEQLRVRGLDGPDKIVNDTATPSLLEGGNLDDTPTMNPALDDILVGGSGNDTLVGGAGIDALFGREGDDSIFSDADVGLENGGQNVAEFSDNGDLLAGGVHLDGDRAAQVGTGDFVCNVEVLLDGGATKDVLTWLRAIIANVVLEFPNALFDPQNPLTPLAPAGMNPAPPPLPPPVAPVQALAGEGEATDADALASEWDAWVSAIAGDVAAAKKKSGR